MPITLLEHTGSLLPSQEPVTDYYPEPETQSTPKPYFLNIHFNIILSSTP